MLRSNGEFVVVAPFGPAVQYIWIVGRRRHVFAEGRRRRGSGELVELDITGRVERRSIRIQVGPGPAISESERAHGVVAGRVRRGDLLSIDIPRKARLDRC